MSSYPLHSSNFCNSKILFWYRIIVAILLSFILIPFTILVGYNAFLSFSMWSFYLVYFVFLLLLIGYRIDYNCKKPNKLLKYF